MEGCLEARGILVWMTSNKLRQSQQAQAVRRSGGVGRGIILGASASVVHIASAAARQSGGAGRAKPAVYRPLSRVVDTIRGGLDQNPVCPYGPSGYSIDGSGLRR